jgi:hypothetical protein
MLPGEVFTLGSLRLPDGTVLARTSRQLSKSVCPQLFSRSSHLLSYIHLTINIMTALRKNVNKQIMGNLPRTCEGDLYLPEESGH